ncbi:MAG: hypothetical protein ACM3S1_03070 [Hyphomicrobiales bacterium]
MVMLTIELDESTYRQPSKRAAESNLSVQELAAAQLASSYAAAEGEVSEEFQAVTAEIIETYRPVLRRLAE